MFVIQADKSQLYVLESEMLVSTASNVYTVRFEFSEDWDGFMKTAIFYNNEDRTESSYSMLIDASNTASIPVEVLSNIGGTVYIGVCGVSTDPDRHLPTISIALGEVKEGICGETVEIEDPTPSLYDQILGELLAIRNLITSGALTGPAGPRGLKGEQGLRGEPGPEGPEGPTGKGITIIGRYDTLNDLQQAVPLPAPGEAYNVGTEPPFDVYIWDEVNQEWRNNGPLSVSTGDMTKAEVKKLINDYISTIVANNPQVLEFRRGILYVKQTAFVRFMKKTDYDKLSDEEKAGFIIVDLGDDVALAPDFGSGGGSGGILNLGTVTATVDNGVGTPEVTVTKTELDGKTNLNFAFRNVKGEKGDTGPQGPQGPAGTSGSQGTAGVTSFNGRSGDVQPQAGDYSVAQVTGAAPTESPVFTGPISRGRKSGTASGFMSVALGFECEASGSISYAEGWLTKAAAQRAHAEGLATEATGDDSHAEGHESYATGTNSHAEGVGTTASGYASHAEGDSAQANDSGTHAEGYGTRADGLRAHAEGTRSQATGNYTHAEGELTTASGYASHSEGAETEAWGVCSHAAGNSTIAEYWCETVVGGPNVRKSPSARNNVGDFFVVGKGLKNDSGTTYANAFRVSSEGVYGTAAFNNSGADYAELFEWLDGNPNKEDRCGRFVTLDGDKIRIADPTSEFILGAISGNPSIIGNVHDDQWQGMYLYDIFGRPIYEEVEVPALTVDVPIFDEDGKQTGTEKKVVIPAHKEMRQKINPAYDSSQVYQPRTKRPEWGVVGMMGQLVMVDDGSCVVNGWCTVGEGGIAVHSEICTGYRVLARLDETHVKIFIL